MRDKVYLPFTAGSYCSFAIETQNLSATLTCLSANLNIPIIPFTVLPRYYSLILVFCLVNLIFLLSLSDSSQCSESLIKLHLQPFILNVGCYQGFYILSNYNNQIVTTFHQVLFRMTQMRKLEGSVTFLRSKPCGQDRLDTVFSRSALLSELEFKISNETFSSSSVKLFRNQLTGCQPHLVHLKKLFLGSFCWMTLSRLWLRMQKIQVKRSLPLTNVQLSKCSFVNQLFGTQNSFPCRKSYNWQLCFP